MPLTINLVEVADEVEVLAFPEYDGFLWTLLISEISSGLWSDDAYIFCTSSKSLRRTLYRRLGGIAEERGVIMEAPKYQKLFIPTDAEEIVQQLCTLGNPVRFDSKSVKIMHI